MHKNEVWHKILHVMRGILPLKNTHFSLLISYSYALLFYPYTDTR